MKKYSLTDEHRSQLEEWKNRWVQNAMSTKPMDDEEKEICRKAVIGLYEAAGKKAPPRERIVFVPSPMVLRFAGGFASAIWHMRKTGFRPNAATDAATRAATRDATYGATDAATRAATAAATRAATYGATAGATAGATYGATDAATRDATDAATYGATDAATYGATDAATRAATDDATADATRAATYAATSAATRDATYDATDAATRAATDDATADATRAATYAATSAATRDATYDATRAATDAATRDATDAATRAATRAATDAATRAATYAATRAATYAATRAATSAATDAATRDATYAATYDAVENRSLARSWFQFDMLGVIRVSAEFNLGKFGLMCAERTYNFWQGGNQWSGWDSFLTFFRHVVKLDIDYSTYDHWEQLALHSGPRIMHEEFCMISDRPSVLLVDSQNRPHCETGPFCKWRDGSALYAIDGIRVPSELCETPKEKLDAKEWLKEENVDIRRVAFKKIGIEKVVKDLGAEVIDIMVCPVGGPYELLMLDIGMDEKKPYLSGINPSLNAPFIEGVENGIKTVKDALMWRNSLKQYVAPNALT